ncbi:MAG: hypothetical protein AAGH89_03630 [Verrucomicrobiota bacterium]
MNLANHLSHYFEPENGPLLSKILLAFTLLTVLALVPIPSSAQQNVPKLEPKDLDWLYTIAVSKEGRNLSFSLMKEGWLSFDTWGDNEQFREKRIDLNSADFASIRSKFETLFVLLSDEDLILVPSPSSFAIERVSEKVESLELSGRHPAVSQFMLELSEMVEVKLPFKS